MCLSAVCVCVCVCVCMRECARIHVYVHIGMYACINQSMCLFISQAICMHE